MHKENMKTSPVVRDVQIKVHNIRLAKTETSDNTKYLMKV